MLFCPPQYLGLVSFFWDDEFTQNMNLFLLTGKVKICLPDSRCKTIGVLVAPLSNVLNLPSSFLVFRWLESPLFNVPETSLTISSGN